MCVRTVAVALNVGVYCCCGCVLLLWASMCVRTVVVGVNVRAYCSSGRKCGCLMLLWA
jgi:hypothetical protein